MAILRCERRAELVPYMVASYAWSMGNVKTTVYLDAADYRRLKGVAAAEGRTTAELIRVAVSEFVNKTSRRPLPRSLGSARGGAALASLSEEEMLEGFGGS